MISRADMAARGVPRTTVDGWYRDRARTGYPEKAGRIGRTDYWYEDEWAAWHEGYLRGKIEVLTQVDREGDPDDLVDAAEAARMLRYANRKVIYANRRLGYFPEPDAHGTTSKGRPAPLWKRFTVWAAADNRTAWAADTPSGRPARLANRTPMRAMTGWPACWLTFIPELSPRRPALPPSGAAVAALQSESSRRRGPLSPPGIRTRDSRGVPKHGSRHWRSLPACGSGRDEARVLSPDRRAACHR